MRFFHALVWVALAIAPSTTSAAEPSFEPVFRENFPDAFVLPYGSQFIAYSTNAGPNVPMASSRDLVHWSFVIDPATGQKRDALPQLGPWAKPGFTWAPEVIAAGGHWLLYYTASDRKHNAQCIGVAIARDPEGPFRDTATAPLICQTKLGGTIDASPFRDADGNLYLYFKNDGNRVHEATALWGQRLTEDGLSTVGDPVPLIGDRERWKDGVIEAPTMVRSPTGYALFYSGGFFGWNVEEGGLSPYSMGYARCSGPLGPCRDSPDNPILHSFHDKQAGCLSGPGHQSVFSVGTRMFISFHAWEASRYCRKEGDERQLYIAPLYWKDGKPVIGPSLREDSARTERG
ncbi:MAG TPA: glycoside hydrolase family 43 protein [Sphingomicrobium sp.]|nr:glycoside hydrolase family 43 protein [Sphingomicrobium sp.]